MGNRDDELLEGVRTQNVNTVGAATHERRTQPGGGLGHTGWYQTNVYLQGCNLYVYAVQNVN